MNFIARIRRPFRYEYWNVALILIGINLLVFLLTYIDPMLGSDLALNPLNIILNGKFWQVFTYQFVHDNRDIMHILANMLGLLFFGMAVETRLGSKEFLLMYLLSGTLCGIFSLLIYIVTGAMDVQLIGASGAIFAILLAYAVLYPDSVVYIWGLIPIPAPILVLGYAGLEVFYMIAGMNEGVAHSTHLIGFAVAWVYFLVRFGINPAKVWSRR